MAEIYDYESGNTLSVGLQGCAICDEAIQAARRLAEERGSPVELHDDDGEWLVHPDGDCERLRPSLAKNANTDHDDARNMYDCYGAHISTESAGDITVQAIDYDWLDETDDQALIDAHRDELDADMSQDEMEQLVAMARSIREDMESIEALLESAVRAYESGDVAATIAALDEASSQESDHGDDPSTSDLRRKLILEG